MLFPSFLSLLINPAQAELSVGSLNAGDLIITEIMHDPEKVLDYKGEWFELYNNSSDSINLNGLIVQDNSGESITVTSSVVVAVGDYIVLGARDIPTQNGGATVDYKYDRNLFRLNSSDAIILSNGVITLDSVVYNTTTTFPASIGSSLNLSSLASDNSLPSSWCEASSSFGDGDLGTPGSANDNCTTLADLGAGDLIITEIMPDPTKVADYRGEWFEIYNNTSTTINLNGLEIGGAGADVGETVSSDVYIAPSGYALFAVRSGSFDNGGMSNVDYKYNYANLSFLLNGDTVSIGFGGTTFDSVSYITTTVGGTFPPAIGKSISLSSTTLSSSSNDNGGNWCSPTASYGDGDFGTPGATNAACANADADGDGFTGDDGDCDDTNSDVFPGATETCDGIDNNCSGDETDASDTVTFYRDSDGDSYGNPSNTTQACSGETVSGYLEGENTDCNDTKSSINPTASELCDGLDNNCDLTIDNNPIDGANYYLDTDGDGYGDTSTLITSCADPSDVSNTYVKKLGDCDESDTGINPGIIELCDATEDLNCDGIFGSDVDTDGDGYTTCDPSNPDCNDSNSSINPGADELCDNVDNNCDSYVDESTATDASTWYADLDLDGFGDLDNSLQSCDPVSGHVVNSTDCDDTLDSVYPGATETCDTAYDDDCDGNTNDPGALNGSTFYLDADNDSHGKLTSTIITCSVPSGYSATSDDCDDSRATVSPSAPEICDSLDNDCDNLIDGADPDVDNTTGTTYYRDADNDLYGTSSNTTQACSLPSGYRANSLDCDDSNYAIKPGATEICDGKDNDCDNATDAADSGLVGGTTYYADGDSDTFGNDNNSTVDCSQPTGYVTDNTDCDDADGTVFPGATEVVADGVDQDCDNLEQCYVDADTDGVGGTNEGSSSSIDCSASGFSLSNTDCNDSDGTVTSDQTYYTDSDGDGYGLTASPTTVCSASAPNGFAAENDDCDDADSDRYPNAPETCNDSIDSDCDGGDNTQTCDSNLASADSTILGEAANDLLGFTLSHAGDIDGDGTPNFAIGARTNGAGGAVYLFNGLPGNSVSAATADAKISGTASEAFGADMSGGLYLSEFTIDGDINGDGTDDLIVGALRNDDNGTDAGAVYVFYGPVTGSIATSDADAVLNGGAVGDLLGRSVTMVGDVNGDNIGDFLISAYKNDFKMSDSGRAYLFYGATGSDALSGTKSLELGAPPADVIFDTFFANSRLGTDLAPAGDLTGDGINEIIIGAEYYDRFNIDGLGCNPDPDINPTCNNRDEGAALVWEGGSFTSHRQFDFTNGDTGSLAAHAIMLGENDQDRIGYSIHGVGDVNGDGTNDFVVGSPYYDGSGTDAGVVYVVSGAASGVEDLGSSSYVIAKIIGTNTNESFGRSVGALGDINGDGTNDFVVGAKGADQNGTDSGGAFIFLGPVSGTFNSNTADSIFAGANAGDEVGTGAVTVGDINAGGRPDLLIGAHHYTSGATFQGGAFVILGENF